MKCLVLPCNLRVPRPKDGERSIRSDGQVEVDSRVEWRIFGKGTKRGEREREREGETGRDGEREREGET